MLLRTSRTDAMLIAASAVFALGGMLLARSGDVTGWWILLACTCSAAAILLRPQFTAGDLRADDDLLDVSSWGVRRFGADGLHEAVSWPDLLEVAVATSARTMDEEDVYVVLRGRFGNDVSVPHSLAVESGVLTALQLRLNGFNDAAFIDALTSTGEGLFVLWRAPRPAPMPAPHPSHVGMQLRAAS
jgi:hypothetical protein